MVGGGVLFGFEVHEGSAEGVVSRHVVHEGSVAGWYAVV